MKILFIDREISFVGSCVVTANVARILAHRHSVKLAAMFIAPGHPNLDGIELVVPSQKVQQFLLKNKLLLTFFGPLVLFLLVLKNTNNVDVLVPGSTPTHWIAALSGKLLRKKIVWNCFEPWIAFPFSDIPKVGVVTWLAGIIAKSSLDKIFVHFIDKIFTLDEKNKKRVAKYYQRKASVIHPGVDFSFFSLGKISLAQKKWHLKKGFIITCVGTLSPMKNQEVLVDAVKQLISEIPDIHLLLGGDGPLKRALEKKVLLYKLSHHVTFLGKLETKDLPHLFAGSDILVFPALNQTWGLTPFEAACVGTPSIVSDDCGASEVIGKQQIGIVVKPTADAIAHAIMQLQSKEKRQYLGKKAKEYVKKHMTWEHYAQNIEAFLTS